VYFTWLYVDIFNQKSQSRQADIAARPFISSAWGWPQSEARATVGASVGADGCSNRVVSGEEWCRTGVTIDAAIKIFLAHCPNKLEEKVTHV